MKQKDDITWKMTLEDVLPDFLRFMNPDADEIFDFDKGVTFLDKELEQLFPPKNEKYSPRVVDKLAKLYTRSGEEEWVLIHVEVQGRYQKDLAKRMFAYYYRIMDKYDKPIAAFVILTGPEKTERPNEYNREFLGTGYSFHFTILSIALQNELNYAKATILSH